MNYFYLGDDGSQLSWEGGRFHLSWRDQHSRGHMEVEAYHLVVFKPKLPPLLLPASWPTWQAPWRRGRGGATASAMSQEGGGLRDDREGKGSLRPHGTSGVHTCGLM